MSRKTRIIGVANQKGGVGKTTTTALLAQALAELDRAEPLRVLVIDLDPQGNLTTRMIGEQRQPDALSLLLDPTDQRAAGLADAIQATTDSWHPNIDIVPGGQHLAVIELDTSMGQPKRLHRALTNATARESLDQYDVVLLDCPPGLGRLLLGGLCASDYIVGVTEPGPDSLAGIAGIIGTIGEVHSTFDTQRPQLAGIIVNRWQSDGESIAREAEARAAFGDMVRDPGGLVFAGHIPLRAAVKDATSQQMPVQQTKGAAALAVSMIVERMARDLLVQVGIDRPEPEVDLERTEAVAV